MMQIFGITKREGQKVQRQKKYITKETKETKNKKDNKKL